jgi:hypothetical protein
VFFLPSQPETRTFPGFVSNILIGMGLHAAAVWAFAVTGPSRLFAADTGR